MYRFAVNLLQPYLLLYLLTGLAIANLWRKRRETRGRLLCVTVLFGTLTLLSIPAVSYLALGTLEWQYPPVDQRPAHVDAIVVLAGGIRPPDAIRSQSEMDQNTLYRCLHGAELYHQGPACPVLVSGGKVDPAMPGPPEADVMRDFLLKLGVNAADVIVENTSRTTYENAVECRKLLEQHRLHKIMLVTNAVDLFRAVRCFRKQGIEAIPSGCNYRATQFEYSLFEFLPSPGAAQGCRRVFHEWAGAVWYWWHGRI
jgi:uncharacterized SAM-binding protein YcdF (DUF218 family)